MAVEFIGFRGSVLRDVHGIDEFDLVAVGERLGGHALHRVLAIDIEGDVGVVVGGRGQAFEGHQEAVVDGDVLKVGFQQIGYGLAGLEADFLIGQDFAVFVLHGDGDVAVHRFGGFGGDFRGRRFGHGGFGPRSLGRGGFGGDGRGFRRSRGGAAGLSALVPENEPAGNAEHQQRCRCQYDLQGLLIHLFSQGIFSLRP